LNPPGNQAAPIKVGYWPRLCGNAVVDVIAAADHHAQRRGFRSKRVSGVTSVVVDPFER